MGNNRQDLTQNNDYSASDILYMLRDLPDACCVFKVLTDPFGTVTDMLFLFVNEKYASLVDKPTSELIGSTFFTTVSNRDEDWIKLSYQAAFMRQSVINRTYNTQFNKWFEFWAVPVYQKGFCAFIIHDVTAEKRKEETREINTNSNKFILDCAKALSANDFKTGIKITLKEVGNQLRAARVSIIEVKDSEIIDVHEWTHRLSGSGLPSKKVIEKYDFITRWRKQLGNNDYAIINDTSKISLISEDIYKSVLEGTISRYVLAALTNKNTIIGYLLVDNYSLDLDINIRDVVESLAIFISEELRNYRMTQEILYMSTHDVLTDLGNRSALNSTITMLNGMDVSVGVCFVDINGLKMYNDQHGHDAGDRIIKDTATAIGAVFKKKYCYRIGGDEFVVVIPQITQEHFQETISKLEMKTKKYSISMGAVWSDTAEDIRELISQADKLMYADKAEYHSVHDRRQEKEQKGE